MARAGLASDKPVDVFKVKAQHKGDARYERPLRAYKELVETNRRAGTYAMRPVVVGSAPERIGDLAVSPASPLQCRPRRVS